MKILQVNCVYNTGSTGKIMYDVHTQLQKQNIESVVCYGRGALTNEKNVYKTCGELYSKFNNLLSRFSGIMYGGCFFSTNKLISVIKKEKPDIVHLHCINGYFVNIYRLVNWLKKYKIKTVLTLHAEFMYTGGCGHAYDCEKWKVVGCKNCPIYKRETHSIFFDRTNAMWKKMKNAFQGFNDDLIVTSVSPWLKSRAEQSAILGDKDHRVVMNGLDERIFNLSPNNKIYNEIHRNKKKAALFVTPIFSLNKEHLKGGYYIIELAKRNPDINFVIIGNNEHFDGLPENIINVGRVENQKVLAQYYTAADVTVVPSRRETFSMVTAESLCCGTPVVGFKAGGPESICMEEYCDFVEYGDIDALEKALIRTISSEKLPEISEKAIEKYKKENMYNGYFEIYNELVK